MADNDEDLAFVRGLKALQAAAFPKRCPCCGRVYANAEQFFAETRHVNPARSSLKQSQDEDGAYLVEAFRNCVCGSTLMSEFGDRRDTSQAGVARRNRFAALLAYLEQHGMPPETARHELLKVARGEGSEVLARLMPPGSPPNG